jgi:predicted dehydrogenase
MPRADRSGNRNDADGRAWIESSIVRTKTIAGTPKRDSAGTTPSPEITVSFLTIQQSKESMPMVRVGLVGVGFMGWIHYLTYQQVRGVKLAAICTRDKVKLAGDWRGIQGNFGPPGEQINVEGMATYEQIDDLLADPDIDLIDICLPPHLHAEVASAALQAGKHVFCEKPMALTVAECRRMVQAANAADRQLLIGHVLPFFPEYAFALRQIESGRYGELLGGHFKRVISDPLWLKDFYDPQRVGGPLIDLHVHDAHLIRLLFGMPQSLTSHGRLRDDTVEYCETIFRFPDSTLLVTATSGVIHQQGRGFTHGFEIHLEKATLQFEFAAFADGSELMPLKVLTANGKVLRPALGGGDPVGAFVAEIKEVVQAVKDNRPSELLSGELARDAIQMCHKQAHSVHRGKAVMV